jgi:hypothetical protein
MMLSLAALGLLSLAVAQTDTDPTLEFNMTFSASQGLLNYQTGWQLEADHLWWMGDANPNATCVGFQYLGFGFCVYGEFEPILNLTTACEPVVGNWLEATNSTSFCYRHQWGYFDIGLRGGSYGVKRLDNVTFFTRPTAPKG